MNSEYEPRPISPKERAIKERMEASAELDVGLLASMAADDADDEDDGDAPTRH